MKKYILFLVSVLLIMGALHNAMGCATALFAENIAKTQNNSTQTITGTGSNDAVTILSKETLRPNDCALDDAEQEIINFYAAQKDYHISHYNASPVDKKIEKDYAYNYGYYEISGNLKGQPVNKQKMAYLILWKRLSDQKWKMYLDIWDYQAPNQQNVYFF